MDRFFLICATIGGTILLLRLGLSILGLAGDGFDGLDADPDAAAGDGQAGASHGHLGKVFTFQAIVAFVAFFGIGGKAALAYDLHPAAAVGTAMAAGLASVVLLGYALGALTKLNTDGTVRIDRAVGLTGTVYLRIPSYGEGEGKITLPIQGRTVEYKARTPGPELRTGEPAIVLRVLDDQTVEVAAPQAAVVKPVSLAD